MGQLPGHSNHINEKTDQPSFFNKLIRLPRYVKRAILMMLDYSLLAFALWLSYSLRLGVFYMPNSTTLWLLLASAPLIGVLSFHYNGLYKMITRFYGNRMTVKVGVAMGIAVLIWCLVIYMTQFTLSHVPRSVIVMYGLISTCLVWFSRSVISSYLRRILSFSQSLPTDNATRVIIYGVGEVGNQLAEDLAHSRLYHLVAFVDDNPSTWRQMLFGVRVFSPAQIEDLIKDKDIKEVFIADTNMSRRAKRQLLNRLAPFSVKLKTLSYMHELAEDGVGVSDLKQIGLSDLLGRTAVPPDQDLLDKTVSGKSVLITGAGGSIGSEIVRQVLKLLPKKIVLYERSELALYNIDYELRKELEDLKTKGSFADFEAPEILSVLGCVCDDPMVRRVILEHRIETIYHAAAYKHVPIVEENPFSGLQNNVLGTLTTARAANDLGVELFVLISTDKAVRPTNVMGASKRLSELCLQALAAEEDTKTIFTMVRFGNVLGSSGSVVGRFKEQIEKGGPVTVTHPEIIRYFMSIPEAAQLVIQAGALARGGDVFVLDMGEPVKILDLAKSMINISGLEVADDENPDGDIAIDFIGLRDGEKLYEELLINENSSKTEHSSIIRNHEDFLPLEVLQKHLDQLSLGIDRFDRTCVLSVLQDLVEGFQKDQTDQSHNDEVSLSQRQEEGRISSLSV